eukprot:TRINITY_DN7479_c0_g1_i1.p1 TRINITY_DN7479_c0_g1~~TRINITY_DN7479_c0_g1_i1.p1  ORF type:complete len:104 (-),score=23.00 TRINITY_DN7479_c0_g1_i1:80-391(-)
MRSLVGIRVLLCAFCLASLMFYFGVLKLEDTPKVVLKEVFIIPNCSMVPSSPSPPSLISTSSLSTTISQGLNFNYITSVNDHSPSSAFGNLQIILQRQLHNVF